MIIVKIAIYSNFRYVNLSKNSYPERYKIQLISLFCFHNIPPKILIISKKSIPTRKGWSETSSQIFFLSYFHLQNKIISINKKSLVFHQNVQTGILAFREIELTRIL
jgi:hypothetical protein